MKTLIADWFFDNIGNIIDELTMIVDLRNSLIEQNDEEFEEEIVHQSYDEFTRGVSISCSTALGLPYGEVYDILEDKLEEIYEAFT